MKSERPMRTLRHRIDLAALVPGAALAAAGLALLLLAPAGRALLAPFTLLALACGGLAFALARRLSHRLTHDLTELTTVARAMADGNLELSPVVHGDAEVEKMTKSMSKQLEA